jgi:hypothetical protein
MLGLNQKLGKRVSVILWGHKKKPSTKVPGFLFLEASKIYFDLRIKQKRRELRQQFGFYAWIEPKIGKTRQRNPPGSQKEPSTKVPGFLFLGASKIYFEFMLKTTVSISRCLS